MISTISVGVDCSALDPTFKAHAGRGIGRYVKSLVDYFEEAGLVQSSKEDDCASKVKIGMFDHSWSSLPSYVDKMISILPRGRQTVRQQLCYPLQLKSARMRQFSLLHFPAHMDAPSWATVPYIVTVLDLIPLILQDLYRPASVDMRFTLARWLELRAIRGAKHLLAISECTARDCHRLLGIPLDKITVTPLGVDDRFFGEAHPDLIKNVRAKYQLSLERPYLLYVGGIDERKNMSGLLRLYKLVHEAERNSNRIPPTLVLAGKIKDDRNFPNLLALIRDNGLEDEVQCIGFVSDDDLLALYQGAVVFLFPSLYEGFGLPPLEALAAGVPVVSSNTSSLPEVLGDAALYFDPTNIADGVSATLCYLRAASEYLDTTKACGRKWARQYTWDETGRKTLSVYERFVD